MRQQCGHSRAVWRVVHGQLHLRDRRVRLPLLRVHLSKKGMRPELRGVTLENSFEVDDGGSVAPLKEKSAPCLRGDEYTKGVESHCVLRCSDSRVESAGVLEQDHLVRSPDA